MDFTSLRFFRDAFFSLVWAWGACPLIGPLRLSLKLCLPISECAVSLQAPVSQKGRSLEFVMLSQPYPNNTKTGRAVN